MSLHICILGAGKSSTCLINYLSIQSSENNWQTIVVDNDLSLAQSKAGDGSNIQAISTNIEDATQRSHLIRQADIIISLLPPALQLPVALDCIQYKKHLLTASYLDDQVKELKDDMKKSGAFFLFEMGLDPGIDHMSAMKWINQIKRAGGTVTSFRSHCGGLVSPGSDSNPWHYKISWNPRNVVMAGNMGATYNENNEWKKVSYLNLFEKCREVHVPQSGTYAYYPNRDSKHYMDTYQLNDAHTFLRTTLRHPAYCSAWHAIVNAGLTTNSLLPAKNCTYEKWSQKIRPFITPQNQEQLEYLGLFDRKQIPGNLNTSADILQYLFETKLSLQENDKDMIIMLHQIAYVLNGQQKLVESSLVVQGENRLETAMAKTVGLPLGIAAKLILQGKINLNGLHIPVLPEIYEPVLEELEQHGIRFRDEVRDL